VIEFNGMQWAFNLCLPKLDELKEAVVVWGEIILLPDELVEDRLKVWHAVKDLGCGQTIAFEHKLCFRQGRRGHNMSPWLMGIYFIYTVKNKNGK